MTAKTFGHAVEHGLKAGKFTYQVSAPHMQYDLDCGEASPVIWCYDENKDELKPAVFTFEQILAEDWEILQ